VFSSSKVIPNQNQPQTKLIVLQKKILVHASNSLGNNSIISSNSHSCNLITEEPKGVKLIIHASNLKSLSHTFIIFLENQIPGIQLIIPN
jgi:hypothetical protein